MYYHAVAFYGGLVLGLAETLSGPAANETRVVFLFVAVPFLFSSLVVVTGGSFRLGIMPSENRRSFLSFRILLESVAPVARSHLVNQSTHASPLG